MWTHQITETGRDHGALQVYVHFTDGARVVDQVFALNQPTSADWLKPQVIAALDRLNGLDANEVAIQKGSTVDLTPVPTIEPTPEELAARQFGRDKNTLEQMAREIELGVRKPDDAAFVALKTSVALAIDASAKASPADAGLKG